ncbi:nifR3 protein [Deinococcus aerophilus]|uniref:tRNA-dihydrouridine synthase n=2 Tax=Deinococcus aerophilus TaxID=522488 RepID=A0ABQ2GHA7_9DEIO|nr:nifR3 protein [Deinococcus aerophilus]
MLDCFKAYPVKRKKGTHGAWTAFETVFTQWRGGVRYPETMSNRPTPSSFYAARLTRPGAVLAPMAGYSDAPMRQLASEHGALWTVSEMISARGLVMGGDTERLNLGRPYPGEAGRVVQLFGAEPEVLAEAVGRAEAWFAPAALDLNMGCPVPKVRGKGGACLLQTPEVAFTLIRAMRSATSLDVSAKIRLGWDSDRSVEVAQGLAAAGAALITVHGRTSRQRYTGEADWDAIARVAASVDVPVVGSGDILSADHARVRQRSGVAAVMIGRGAVGNPWIFRALSTGDDTAPDLDTRAHTALRHAELQTRFYNDDSGRLTLRPLRKVLPRYLPDRPELHADLVQVVDLDDVRRALAPVLGGLPGAANATWAPGAAPGEYAGNHS